MQAGLISGNLIQEMGKSIKAGGPLALWTVGACTGLNGQGR